MSFGEEILMVFSPFWAYKPENAIRGHPPSLSSGIHRLNFHSPVLNLTARFIHAKTPTSLSAPRTEAPRSKHVTATQNKQNFLNALKDFRRIEREKRLRAIVRQEVEAELQNLILARTLEVMAIDRDGSFCYALKTG